VSETSISFKNAEVRYSRHVFGLRRVTLSVNQGDFVFFIGKTGAGKSTLLKLLSREVRATSGSVLYQGRPLERLRERDVPGLRRNMGIVPQETLLLPRKRVWENVAYAMRAIGHSKRDVRRRVPEILESVNIGQRADAFPHELSGGERQRVLIARALINDPPLLLADEPTGNLDPEHSWDVMQVLLDLNARGTTVLVASHDMMVIHRMNRRIITLDQGVVIADTAQEAVIQDPPDADQWQPRLDFDREQAKEEPQEEAEPAIEEEPEPPQPIPPETIDSGMAAIGDEEDARAPTEQPIRNAPGDHGV